MMRKCGLFNPNDQGGAAGIEIKESTQGVDCF